jgi:beta-xylosidase
MTATATLEELQRVRDELNALKMKNPDIYQNFSDLFKNNRIIGYKNIVKMLIGEADPEKLKAQK